MQCEMRKLRVESNELLHHLSPSKQANGVKISIGSTYWRCRVGLTFHRISIDCRRRVLCGCLMLLLLLYLVRARTHTNTQRHKCSTVRVWTQKGNGGRWVGGGLFLLRPERRLRHARDNDDDSRNIAKCLHRPCALWSKSWRLLRSVGAPGCR